MRCGIAPWVLITLVYIYIYIYIYISLAPPVVILDGSCGAQGSLAGDFGDILTGVAHLQSKGMQGS